MTVDGRNSILMNFVVAVFFATTFPVGALAQRRPLPPKRFELLSGVRNTKDMKIFWDKKYGHTKDYVFGKSPAKFLSLNFDYLPPGSKVLDVGMGEGRNAVFLAQKGHSVTGIDISSVAVKKARMLAQEYGVAINTVVSSVEKYRFPEGSFDVVICFYYVNREIHEKMISWLKPGGLLIYESHTDMQLQVKGHEHYDKRYLLRPGELLGMFKGMKVLKYEEPQHTEEYTASIILQRP